jgi:hypothetical protein
MTQILKQLFTTNIDAMRDEAWDEDHIKI